jgi:hypothetical protein
MEELQVRLPVMVAYRIPGVEAENLEDALSIVRTRVGADVPLRGDRGTQSIIISGSCIVPGLTAKPQDTWKVMVTYTGKPEDSVPVSELDPGATCGELHGRGATIVVVIPLDWVRRD